MEADRCTGINVHIQQSEAASIAAMAARSDTVMEDLSDNRQYNRSVDRARNETLVAAIAAAAAENMTVATVLRYELGSPYLRYPC